MRRFKEIWRDTVSISLSSVISALTQWLIVISVARFDGVNALGYYALCQAVVIPISYFAWLGAKQQILSGIADDDVHRHIILRCIVPVFSFALGYAAIATFRQVDDIFPYFIVCVGIKIIDGYFDIWSGILQRNNMSFVVLRYTIIRAVSFNIMFVLTYYFVNNILFSFVSGILMLSLTMIPLLIDRRNLIFRFRNFFSTETYAGLRSVFVFSVPFAISNVVMSLSSVGLRLVVETRLGSRELGYFAAIYQFVLLGSIVQTALGQAVLPKFSASASARRWGDFWKLLIWSCFSMLSAGLGACLISSWVGSDFLSVIYGNEFSQYSSFMSYMACAAGFQYASSMFGVAAFSLRFRGPLLTVYSLTSLVSVSVAYFSAVYVSLNSIVFGIVAGSLVQILLFGALLFRSSSTRVG